MDPVALKTSHLYLSASVATAVFGDELRAFVAYDPERSALLLAPASAQWFKKMHKASQHMLKVRNQQGDRTVALHEILIDHEVDDQDRSLEYTVQEKTGILKITL
ncbi:MAG: hypothetical protein WA958_12835 [Tunicatimonas sp.]